MNGYSKSSGSLAEGCRLCVKGRKTVIFVTGICGRGCFYCPISDQKHEQDVVFINERQSKSMKDAFREIELCSSQGAGITGGDPLARPVRTLRYIKALKNRFGKSFHIHLYTPLNRVNERWLKRLHQSGLDEIRFHPDIDDDKHWDRLKLAKRHDWAVGIEIPAIPGKGTATRKLLRRFAGIADFVNLNELEISDTNANQLLNKGFRTRDRLSYGVRGSEALALRLLDYCSKLGVRCHYCTTRLKDGVQLRNRIKRRARNVKAAFDIVTDDGMLVRGAVYGSVSKALRALRDAKAPAHMYRKDGKRVVTSVQIVRKQATRLRRLGLRPAIVEEYPTHDQLNIVTDFL